MKTFILSIIVTMITSVAGAQQKSFYDFTVKTIDGKDLPLSTFKGKKVLVVNVASKCGFTPQYAKLEELYEKYGKDDFVVIGFPANNFLHQEPGTNEEIKEFCTLNYGVNATIYSERTVQRLERAFENDMTMSTQVTRKIYEERNLLIRFKEQFSRLLSPLL